MNPAPPKMKTAAQKSHTQRERCTVVVSRKNSHTIKAPDQKATTSKG